MRAYHIVSLIKDQYYIIKINAMNPPQLKE